MNHSSLTLRSFAKINWHLRILGKRADGYHELWTVLQTISLADELRFEKREDDKITLACDDQDIPTDHTNLIIRAGHLLREWAGINAGASVELKKRIPSQAGLGGGSSNASMALLAFSVLWGLDGVDLPTMAEQIGADVPFFLMGGRALGQGTGATVSPLSDCETSYLIVVSPTVAISTASAYKAVDSASLTSANPIHILAGSSADSVSTDCDLCPLHNDFEAVIFEIEPEIERAKMALLQSGSDGALLAGSGSSVFGIFATEEARQKALERLQREAGWRVFCCETLARKNYLESIGIPDSRLLNALRKLSSTGA